MLAKRLITLIVGPLVVAIVATAMFFGLKAAYGGFGHYYDVKVTLPRAGEQMERGAEVRMRGVIIGKVTAIKLVDRKVQLNLQLEQRYKVPASSSASVNLTTLLGAKYVDLGFADYRGPYLANGDTLKTGYVGPELEDALADGVDVLDAIRPSDLATLVETLANASRGHGDDVARGLAANHKLSDLFAGTLDAQLQSLHDFDIVFGTLRDSGIDLNALADAINVGVPVYASQKAQQQLDRALTLLAPFANNLADLFVLNRKDWDRLMNAGDTVLQNVSMRPKGLQDLVHGLYTYVYKLGGQPCTIKCGLNDGSGAAGFVNFIGGNTNDQSMAQFCDALPPEIRDTVPICNGTVPLP